MLDDDIFNLAAALIGGLTVVVAALLYARHRGLTDAQQELRATRGEVIVTLQAQVNAIKADREADRLHFEAELRKKDTQIAHLEMEVKRLNAVVDALTRKAADA